MNYPFAQKGRIGIITGAGPEAGIDLWKKILHKNKQILNSHSYGDVDAPHVVVHSVPSMGLVMEIEKHEEVIKNHLLDTIVKLDGQIDYFCIACNILHYYSSDILMMNNSCEFVSIVEPIKRYINLHNIKKIALLSIGTVMDLGPYSPYKELTNYVEIETPDSLEMNEIVKGIKSKGADDKELVLKFHDILNKLTSETVILACTELPLLPTTGIKKNLIDATDLLAEELAIKANSVSIFEH